MFARIMLPLVQPGLICISVFNFVSIWNEYMLALVFASSKICGRSPLNVRVERFHDVYFQLGRAICCHRHHA